MELLTAAAGAAESVVGGLAIRGVGDHLARAAVEIAARIGTYALQIGAEVIARSGPDTATVFARSGPDTATVFAQSGPDTTEVLEGYGDVFGRVVGFVVGATVVYVLGRLLVVRGLSRVVRQRNRNNPTVASASETYLHALVVGLASLAGIIGAGYGKVLTDSALIIAAFTFIIGVAGQEVIGSLISGMFLVADRDFNVGDWIAWPGGEGIVEAVDFRVTRVRTLDNETITVPNTELTENALTRPYGRERFRVTERVDVAYGDDVELALKELRDVAQADDRVLDDPAPTPRVQEFAGSSVGLQAQFWIADPMEADLPEVRSSFRRRVKRRFDEVGLTLGPPSGQQVSGRLSVEVEDEGEREDGVEGDGERENEGEGGEEGEDGDGEG